MSVRSVQQLTSLFDKSTVVLLEEMREALTKASRATVFRHLAKVSYRRSYNHNGRYYTKHDLSRYDKYGLFSHNGIHFSRDGSLNATVLRLICESSAGQTQRELQELIRVRVQTTLLAMIRNEKVAREKIEGCFVYLHPEHPIRKTQIDRRHEMFVEQAFADEVTGTIVIQVLLVLIRYPGSRAGDVARRLKGHSPPITMQHVQVVFDRYDLDDVGKKRGPSRR